MSHYIQAIIGSNGVLRELQQRFGISRVADGAKKGLVRDEFEAIGLGRFRSNEDWLEQPRPFGKEPDAYSNR